MTKFQETRNPYRLYCKVKSLQDSTIEELSIFLEAFFDSVGQHKMALPSLDDESKPPS